jgi:hypothetical protein
MLLCVKQLTLRPKGHKVLSRCSRSETVRTSKHVIDVQNATALCTAIIEPANIRHETAPNVTELLIR